jgi:hypothetical protein
MENKNSQNNHSNHPQWGEHNPKLTEDNFIDRSPKKISDQNELLTPVDTPINLADKSEINIKK